MSDKIDRLFPQFIDDIDLLQPEYNFSGARPRIIPHIIRAGFSWAASLFLWPPLQLFR